MTVIERLKLELNSKEYMTDDNLNTLLSENGLTGSDNYDKATMQRDLLWTVIDILEALSNSVDYMMSIKSDFASTSDAYNSLERRIEKIKNRIYEISDNEEDSNITLLFRRSF